MRLRDPRVWRASAVVLIALGLLFVWVLPDAVAVPIGLPLCVFGLAFLVGWELAR